MFIVVLHYKKPLDIIDKYISAHRAHLDTGYQNNFLVASGPQIPRTGGILISQLHDRKALENFIHTDPYFINDLAEYEIIEFDPVKHHKDFIQFL